MANATTTGKSRRTIEITGLDENWESDDYLGPADRDIEISAIKFYPSAANDRMIIRDKSATGPTLFDTGVCQDTGGRIEYFDPPVRINLFINISECTLDTAANAKVVVCCRFV